jgi:BlaR1 peptidase M56/Gram-negative bacterial TonB protein C-terminal
MNWLHYLLEANIYLAAFYLLYFVFFDKETLYKLNRAYLLVTSILSYVIPVIQIGALRSYEKGGQVVTIIRNNAFKPLGITEASRFTLQDGILYAYILGAAIMLILFIAKIFQLVRLTKAGKDLLNDKYKLVKIKDSSTAFSFFNYVFIGTKVSCADTIIRHELVHITQKHSFDIVFLELIKIINWFNPFIYLLQRSLKTVHEYIADEQTAAYENDALAYSSFLVSNAYGISGSSITHSFFNYNLLKKRIVMLNQKRSGNLARLKYLMVLPVFAALLCVSTLGFSKTYGWVDVAPNSLKGPLTNKIKILEGNNVNLSSGNDKHAFNNDTDKIAPPPKPPKFSKKHKNAKTISADRYIPPVAAPPDMKNSSDMVPPPPPPKPPVGEPDAQQKMPPPPPPPQNPFDSLYKYIAKHVRYPSSARTNHVAGRVIAVFNITDGKMYGVKIVKGLEPDMDAEIIRVIKNFNAPLNARPAKYNIPISFALEDANGKMVGNSPGTNKKYAANKTLNIVPGQPVPDATSYTLDEVVVMGYE